MSVYAFSMIGERKNMCEVAREFEAACRDLAKIAAALGDEAAFNLLRRSWPTLSRKMLIGMLSYSERPHAFHLKKLIGEFGRSMACQ